MERWYPSCINNEENGKTWKGAIRLSKKRTETSKGHNMEQDVGQHQQR